MSKKRSQVHLYFNLWQEKFQVAEDTSIQSVLRKISEKNVLPNNLHGQIYPKTPILDYILNVIRNQFSRATY